MQYEYPKITGYKWNALQKISLALVIPMEQISLCENSQFCYVNFIGELTSTQKSTLDNIMANNPCSPPSNTGKTTYKVPDLWGMRQWFFINWGITPTMWFEEDQADGSGECYIYLHFPRPLTSNEKRQIVSVYSNAMKEVV